MLQKVSTTWRLVIACIVVVSLVAVGLVVEQRVRCHGEPLSREEAFQRAHAKLQRFSEKFVLGEALPPLVDERYDADQKLWSFTFRNSTCEIIILADRCKGTDVGGTNGCKVR
jgi:hypothetical protein